MSGFVNKMVWTEKSHCSKLILYSSVLIEFCHDRVKVLLEVCVGLRGEVGVRPPLLLAHALWLRVLGGPEAGEAAALREPEVGGGEVGPQSQEPLHLLHLRQRVLAQNIELNDGTAVEL